MASPKSTELSATELELKRRGRRRLIGAIALGLLIVVFLPMLFDDEPRRDRVSPQDISIQLPPKDGLAPLPAPSRLPQAPTPAAEMPGTLSSPPSKPAKGEAPVPKPEPSPVAVGTKQTSEAVKAPIKESAHSATMAPSNVQAKSVKPADIKHGFVVQVGAFRDADNAQQTVSRMKQAELPVYTDSVATKTGNVTRVRVGPFARKDQADAALAQIKLAGADGKIVPLP